MEQKKKVNEVDKGAIDAAVQQALDSDMPKPMPRPKARPTKVPRPKPRPEIRIGGMPGGSTRGIDPKDNYSPEDLKRLLMQSAMERMNEVEEGYYVMPDIDKERYTPMDGLEGPFQTKAGKPIYYDPKEGAYYDRDTDMYLTYSEFKALDEGYSPGDENEEGMVSNCCGAPVMDVYDGHGRCSDCKEMASAVVEDMNDGEITKDSVKASALELLVDIAKTSKQYKGEVTKDQVHYLGSLVHDFDMAGIDEEKYSEIEKLFRSMASTEKADMTMIQPAYAQAKTLDENVAVRRDGKTLSKAEIAKLQRQGVLMKEGEEVGMIIYVGDQKFEYYDYTLEDAMRIVDEYADEMDGEPYEVYNADGKLVSSGTMRSGAFHEPGIEEGKSLASLRNRSSFDAQNRMQNKNKPTAKVVKPAQMDLFKTEAKGEDKPYICVHAKKGKHECHAESSYAAAKKAAKHWGLKSTSGIDAHLAESMPMKPLSQPKRVSMTNKQNFRKNFSKRYIDMYPATSEGHSPHKKGTKKYKAHMAAMHANSVDLNTMRDALKLDENTDANTVIAEYTRATLDHSYKTWKQVNEQIEFIRSFVKEEVDVNAVAVMLHRMHERENLDQSMQVKENVSKLRQIVKENNTMKVTFNDGDMNVDATTAKVFLEVYNKQKSQKQNQIVEKIQTKSGFLSMLEMMYKKIG